MDDSDEYWDDQDDLVLTEDIEETLNKTEQQFAATQAARAHANPVQPAAKKQRTETGWTRGLGGRSDSLEFEFPEITVQENGYYASARNPPGPTPPPRPHQSSTTTGSSARIPRQNAQANQAQRQLARNSPAPVPQRQQASNYPPRPASVNRTASSSTAQSSRASPAPAAPHPLENQVQLLRNQLEQLRQSNAEIQTALQEAMNNKTAKEGEVTILRKTIEKNSQNHAAEIARLKSAKQESEAKHLQMQKSMKEEMERLKSQLAFKHQEVLEATFKKPPASARAKKILRDVPGTPLSNSSVGGFSLISQRPNFVIDAQQTPSRPQYVPSSSPRKVPQRSPTKLKKPVLPGFHDSFTSSTPLRPSQHRSKGKEREMFPVEDSNMFAPIPHQSQSFNFPPKSPTKPERFGRGGAEWSPSKRPDLSIATSAQSPRRLLHQGPPESNLDAERVDSDVDMGQAEQIGTPQEVVEEVMEEYDTVEPMNWKAEFARLILTHVPPNRDRTAFQHVLGAPFDGVDQFDDSKLFTTACIHVMNAIARPGGMEGYEQCLREASASFITIISVLSRSKLFTHLSDVFNLLQTLIFYIPKFRGYLLGEHEAPTSSPLTILLCELIVVALTPPSDFKELKEEQKELSTELLAFLRAVCFELSEDDALKFSDMVRNREVMSVLLLPTHPNHLLEQVTYILAMLSTKKQLHRALLSLPEPNQPADTTLRNGINERLCHLLTEPSRDFPESYKLRDTILTFFAQLSIAHSDAHAALSASPIILPSVIWYIAQLTTPLWEDQEWLMNSPDNALVLVQHLARAIYFTYNFIFSTDPPLNLRHKLQQVPPRTLTHIIPVFIVAFCRLAYSDIPDWLEDDAHNVLHHMIEISKDILEQVIDGPEGEDLWHAYQDEVVDEQLDEEEMEAQMMEAD